METMEKEKTTVFNNQLKNKRNQSAWFGVLVVAFGFVLLGLNMGFIPDEFRRVFISWQMVLIAIGLFNLFIRHITSGLILLLVGGFFVLPRLAIASPEYFAWVNPNFTQLFWPLLLIVAGILIIASRSWKPKKYHSCHRHSHHKYEREESNYGSRFTRNVVFSGADILVVDPVFYGCELNSVFGGIELDLRKTTLPEGTTVVEANAVFGGIAIYVPEDWHVEVHTDSVFGDFSDARSVRPASGGSRKLLIKGASVFGGGELKN